MSDFDKLTRAQLIRACEIARGKIEGASSPLSKAVAAWRKVPLKDRAVVFGNLTSEATAYRERYSGPQDVDDAKAFEAAVLVLRAAAKVPR
jgi:hypothetical protein